MPLRMRYTKGRFGIEMTVVREMGNLQQRLAKLCRRHRIFQQSNMDYIYDTYVGKIGHT